MNLEQQVYVRRAAPGNAAAIEAAVEELFLQLPAAARLCAGSRVLIKPNLLGRHAPAKAATTHPLVLRAVIRAVQRRGAVHITVADSPGGPYNPGVMRALYDTCGISQVCSETGATCYTACESVEVAASGELVSRFNLLQPVAESDFIINLPKLKTHVLLGMTGAVKNLFGCVPGLQKAEFHMRFPEKDRFSRMIVDLCETVGADIHLVDALVAMEGDGPGSGDPRELGLLFASQNPYLLDLAMAHQLGLPAAQLPLLAEATRRGLAPQAFDPALLAGDADATTPVAAFKAPSSYDAALDFSGRVPALLRPAVQVLTRHAAPKPAIRRQKCIGCGKCAEICPQRVITMPGGKAKIAYRDCIRCFCCHEMCPAKAIDVRRNALLKKL